MKPNDHIAILTDVGVMEGTLQGWDANGLKMAVYDSYTAWIKWRNIYRLEIT